MYTEMDSLSHNIPYSQRSLNIHLSTIKKVRMNSLGDVLKEFGASPCI